MRELIFKGVWIKQTSTSKTLLVLKGQGLHTSGLIHIKEDLALDVYFTVDLSYDLTTKCYSIIWNSKGLPTTKQPTGLQIAEVGAAVATILRKEGLYRAEYSQEGYPFSQMNN